MDYPRGLTETKPLHVHASYEYSFPETFTVKPKGTKGKFTTFTNQIETLPVLDEIEI